MMPEKEMAKSQILQTITADVLSAATAKQSKNAGQGRVQGEQHQKLPVDPIPDKPDPFWPNGAVPTHMPVAAAQVLDAAWEAVGVDGKWRCAECNGTTQRSIRNPQLCATCYAKLQEQTTLMRRTNEGWMDQAQQLGLALYERQPEETDNEWLVWEKYRSYYPLAMPKWTALANELGLSVGFVIKTSQRWNFKARMIQWAKAVDGEGQEKRILAVRAMHEKQLSVAQRMLEKVSEAVDSIDPALLRPNEIVAMAKLGTELERNITQYHEEKVESTAVATQEQAKQRTKAEDLQEVMSILQQTGIINGSSVVGVEQKTTVLVKGLDT